jgi:hypothetical protein
MATRGIFGFKYDGNLKVMYHGADSYPRLLGVKVLEFIKNNSINDLKELFNEIKLVDENSKPLKSEYHLFWELLDLVDDPKLYEVFLYINGGKEGERFKEDYYELLRPLQLNLESIFHSKMICDGSEFINNPSMEWMYIINLDEGVLEIYEGTELIIKIWIDPELQEKSDNKHYFTEISEITNFKDYCQGIMDVGRNI